MRRKRKSAASKGPSSIQWRHETSAGGIVWRRDGERIEIVMVRPAGKEAWTLPKGTPLANETRVETAARETREETGLEVRPGEPVGQISYVFSWRDTPGAAAVRIFKRVHYFLMEPIGGDTGAHDTEIDEVRWIEIAQAIRQASYKSDREIIEQADAMLRRKSEQDAPHS